MKRECEKRDRNIIFDRMKRGEVAGTSISGVAALILNYFLCAFPLRGNFVDFRGKSISAFQTSNFVVLLLQGLAIFFLWALFYLLPLPSPLHSSRFLHLFAVSVRSVLSFLFSLVLFLKLIKKLRQFIFVLIRRILFSHLFKKNTIELF